LLVQQQLEGHDLRFKSPDPLSSLTLNQIKPLQFNLANLKGLSEKLIVSHHQNNYGGAVRRLNQIQQQIGGLPTDAQPYQMGSLKLKKLLRQTQ